MSKNPQKHTKYKNWRSVMSIIMLLAIFMGTTAGCQTEEEADSYAESEEKYIENESDISADSEKDYTESEENTSDADVDGETEDISESEQAVNIYTLYAEIVQEYEDMYGQGSCEVEYTYGADNFSCIMNGTYLVQLLDFNGDGQEELLIGVCTDAATCWVDVWAYENGEAVKVYSPELQAEESLYIYESGYAYYNIVHGSDIGLYVEYTSYSGKIYLIQGFRGSSEQYYYFEYTDGVFQRVKTIEALEENDWTPQIDGQTVTESEWSSELALWNDGLVSYLVRGGGTEMGNTLLEITAQTKAVLGMEEEAPDLTAYASVVQQYEETYGAIGYNVYYQNQETQTGETYMLTGLCLVQPIDFDGDSVYELLIGYGETVDASTGLTEVHGDVWGLDGDTPVLLYSGASFPGESYYNAIAYKHEDGVYYLYDGYSENRFAHIDIYCLTDGSFTKVYTLEADFSGDSPIYTLNGAAISMSEYAGYVSDGLTEFYAQVSSLESFEVCQDDLSSVFSQMGLQ